MAKKEKAKAKVKKVDRIAMLERHIMLLKKVILFGDNEARMELKHDMVGQEPPPVEPPHES